MDDAVGVRGLDEFHHDESDAPDLMQSWRFIFTDYRQMSAILFELQKPGKEPSWDFAETRKGELVE